MTRATLLWTVPLALGLSACGDLITCPEGTAVPDFDEGGRTCEPIGGEGGDAGQGGQGGEAAVGGDAGMGGEGGEPTCIDDSECTDAFSARCGPSTGLCEPCTRDEHCEGAEGGPRCEDGACVECTPALESRDCPFMDNSFLSCDPATFTCSGIEQRSRDICEPCVSDTDCDFNLACIELSFQGVSQGGACLLPTAFGCERPISVPLLNRVSLSGADPTDYCGLDEERATCAAIMALEDDTRCDTDDDCPTGGVCREVGALVGTRCTYECSLAAECPDAPTAGTCGPGDTDNPAYCGG